MLGELFDVNVCIGAAVALAAGLMRGFAGVGSGMLMAPIFAIVFGPLETVAIIIVMEWVVTAQLLPGVAKDIDWRLVGLMGAAATVFMPAGSWLLHSVDAELMTRGVALLVLIVALVLLAGWRYEGQKRALTSALVGAVSGVMLAATSLGNPPVMIYLLSSRDGATSNRANFTGYFAVTLTALIVWMMFIDAISAAALTRAAIFLPGFMLATWLGARLFKRSSEVLYRRVALGLLVCVGVFGLVR
ncbi:MAG: putative membrane protein YfcA [Gammaproteobacteria bacterium]|jgi:uncharacterized membrane protein YfcA